MTPIWKRGAVVQILLDQFTDEEWSAIHPWTSARCEARQMDVARPLSVTVNPDVRTILLAGDSADWPEGLVDIDLLIARDGHGFFLPPASYFRVNILPPATEVI